MAVDLPEICLEQFRDRLWASIESSVRKTIEDETRSGDGGETIERCYAHYCELRRWSARASLIGPGTAAEAIERHWGESLAALPFLPTSGRVLDIGSGAGFPGLVLACARPALQVTLIEPRHRKVAFLRAAVRRAGVACIVIADSITGTRLPSGLPERVDCITLRALRLPDQAWKSLSERLSIGGEIIVWAGAQEPELPLTLARVEESQLRGARVRRLIRATPEQGHNGAPTGLG